MKDERGWEDDDWHGSVVLKRKWRVKRQTEEVKGWVWEINC